MNNLARLTHGFTLIELLVALSIAAILAVVAVPSFQNTLQNSRSSAQASALVASFNLARSESVKRARPVTACASSNGTACTATSWANGWLVWADDNQNGALDSGEIVRVISALEGGSVLTEASNTAIVQYQPSGAVAASLTFSLTIPNCTGDHARSIVVNSNGRVESTPIACP